MSQTEREWLSHPVTGNQLQIPAFADSIAKGGFFFEADFPLKYAPAAVVRDFVAKANNAASQLNGKMSEELDASIAPSLRYHKAVEVHVLRNMVHTDGPYHLARIYAPTQFIEDNQALSPAQKQKARGIVERYFKAFREHVGLLVKEYNR